MARVFVLIDALPRREGDVYESVAKVPGVVARRLLKDKVANADVLVLLEGSDADAVEKLIAGHLRGVTGVHTVRKVMAHHTIAGPMQRIMQEMAEEAAKRPP